ncbi:MAG TPA: lipopolysaccharide assembly protein LapA domain-containing protein [Actinophytocola sp.]|uniref:LapA family protein n=1 Tax=Actinophytocola sp. TaxID=1872138 RepID=UPI002DB88BF9|nr:lipopolysaccharide assembly protein LapA domain-containing protein [Actinophytocola sp.]HEU5469518.1 lipopolysaccharide assembly protein LapA domain-containing protein [Actinophytocola sp.]
MPRTRTGAAWLALIAAALLGVLLIVFLAQNTHSTEISFLWMTTSTPLAVALLIAAVGSVLITLIIGTARITQLRRQIRKNRT